MQMKFSNREMYKNVQVAHFGLCSSDCSETYCQSLSQICLRSLIDKRPSCVKKQSSKDCEDFSPVCDTENETHINQCYLLNTGRRNGQPRQLAYFGPCRKGVTCKEALCQSDSCFEYRSRSNSIPVCYDPSRIKQSKMCRERQESICGSDNRTYDGFCDLNNHIVANNEFIDIISMDAC
ncbi:hypothetical protein ACOME3_000489 [Neoechinorhynchus agilis]